MENKQIFLGLDVGERRIGVAVGDSIARIAQPVTTIEVNDAIDTTLAALCAEYDVTALVIGLPRNQSGATTNQTLAVQAFAKQVLEPAGFPLHWQDESITSVLAEDRLKARNKPYSRADIDAEAAAIILQDYLERL